MVTLPSAPAYVRRAAPRRRREARAEDASPCQHVVGLSVVRWKYLTDFLPCRLEASQRRLFSTTLGRPRHRALASTGESRREPR